MADMTEMEMALPENTLPMMTGKGPFGSLEMGGMFSVLKVRRDLPAGRYEDPGWFAQGPRAQEVELASSEILLGSPIVQREVRGYEVRVVKPSKSGRSL